jgi:hypothetical protein
MERYLEALASRFLMITEGQSIQSISGKGNPLMAKEFGIVCAALACGFPPSSESWLLDVVEAEDPTQREFVFTFDGDTKASFNGEVVSLKELSEHFWSDEWCRANDEHPISYMRSMWNQIVHLRDALRTRKPSVRMQKTYEDEHGSHTVTAIFSPDMPEEEKAEILQRYEEAG